MRSREQNGYVTTSIHRDARKVGREAADRQGMKFYAWLSNVVTEAAQKVLKNK